MARIECCKGCPHYSYWPETQLEPEENSCAKDWECSNMRCANWTDDEDCTCDYTDTNDCTGYDFDCAWYHSEGSNEL